MTDRPEIELPRRQRWWLGTFVYRFPQVHMGIGLLGNTLFVCGSLLYITGRDDVGVWFFLTGSCGMLLGALGEAMRVLGKRRLARFDIDPYDPDTRWSESGRTSSPLD